MSGRTVHVTPDRIEQIAFKTGKTVELGGEHPRIVDGDTTYLADVDAIQAKDES